MSSPVIRNGSPLLLAKKFWLQPCISRSSHKAEKQLPVSQPQLPSVLTLGTRKSFFPNIALESLSMKYLKNLIPWTKRWSSFLWPSSPGSCQPMLHASVQGFVTQEISNIDPRHSAPRLQIVKLQDLTPGLLNLWDLEKISCTFCIISK